VSRQSLPRHDAVIHRILSEIETGRPVSQRSLARDMGVALGLTNLVLRRLVRKGYVKMTRVNSRQVAYLLTPEGLVEKGRIARAYIENTLRLYTDTREHIHRSLDRLSSEWDEAGPTAGEKRIVFFGAGEVAEIGYVGLQGTDLRLVGVVDDVVKGPFFGMPVVRSDRLADGHLDGEPFGRLVVMSIRNADAIRQRLNAIGYPQERTFWL
jgi:DNA-binding MarR family transcriptional regulator